MLRVAIVGDRGSGKTTFLGLLYAALVRSGSGRTDELRFHATYASMEEVTGLFQRLMSGAFPDSATKEGIHGFDFELGVRKPGRRFMPRLGSGKWATGGSTDVHVTLPGVLDGQASGLFRGSTIGTGPWRDALDADVVIVLVDGAGLAPKGEHAEGGPMSGYDGQVTSLLTAIRRWRARGGRQVLHPFFVFSRFDSVSPETLRAENLEPSPPAVGKTGLRAAYAKTLLGPNLPRTLSIVEESGGSGFRFGRPDYFFTWVRTEARSPEAPHRVRLRPIDGGGWEPDYSREEYVALLKRLGEIAGQTTD